MNQYAYDIIFIHTAKSNLKNGNVFLILFDLLCYIYCVVTLKHLKSSLICSVELNFAHTMVFVVDDSNKICVRIRGKIFESCKIRATLLYLIHICMCKKAGFKLFEDLTSNSLWSLHLSTSDFSI